MDPNSEARLAPPKNYPKIVYLETMIFFFGANFLFHHHVFRTSQNRLQFGAFLFVNLFTSYQLAEGSNLGCASYHSSIFNNQ
jgi:hypothetical protein